MGDLNTGLTREQMSERGRKAGLKSAEVRREKKRMREWAEIIGEKDTTVINADGEEETMPYDMAVVVSMYQKAIDERDVRAAEFIAKLKGEAEMGKLEIKADIEARCKPRDLTPEEAMELVRHLEETY